MQPEGLRLFLEVAVRDGFLSPADVEQYHALSPEGDVDPGEFFLNRGAISRSDLKAIRKTVQAEGG
ncbi:MAG: hypothetical protein ACYTAF_08405 [Planctomycetota bacterium]|jgi:hypothetical protein